MGKTKVKLSEERQIELAEMVCEFLGISIDGENAWAMAEFIDFDAINNEVWFA